MRILHLLDQTADWWDFDALDQLIGDARRSPGRIEIRLACMGGTIPARFRKSWPPTARLGFPARVPLAAATWLRGLLRQSRCDLVHAWGVIPAATARMAGLRPGSLMVTMSRPLADRRENLWLLAARRDFALPAICPSGAIRRNLIESGHPPGDVGIIRPGINFARMNAANRAEQRARLKIDAEAPVLITCPPPSRAGGQYFALWAAALLAEMMPDIRLIVPGLSDERHRLNRFVREFRRTEMTIFPDPECEFVDLLAAADVCVASAISPVSAVPLAWAMGAKVPLVGSAIPAIAELLAHGQNALLCRARRPDLLAARILTLLRDRDLAWRLADAARGQAFEVFRRTRLLEQYHSVYENLKAGRPALDRIADAALHA